MATFVVANHHDGALAVNLLTPIVVSSVFDICAQVILEGQDYDIRHRLTVFSPA